MLDTIDNPTLSQPSPHDTAEELLGLFDDLPCWRNSCLPNSPFARLQFFSKADEFMARMPHLDQKLFALLDRFELTPDDMADLVTRMTRTEATTVRFVDCLNNFLANLRARKAQLTTLAARTPSSAKSE